MARPDSPNDSAISARETRWALVTGFVISVLLGAALVVPAAQAGITPGVSPLVVLFCWVLFGRSLGPRLKRFLAIAQVTGSGGAAVTAGVVFTAPILPILFASLGHEVPPLDVLTLILASLSGVLIGFGYVGLATRRFLSDPNLPAPEAVACDRLIRTGAERPDERPRLGPSLVAGLCAGALIKAATHFLWLRETVWTLGLRVWSRTSAPDLTLPAHLSPLYLGIGGLLTLPTAVLIFLGGLVNATTTGYSATHGLAPTTFRWVGGAAMTVAVFYSLVHYIVEGRSHARANAAAVASAQDAQLEQSPAIRRLLFASIAAGAALLVAMTVHVGGSPVALVVMTLAALVLMWLLSGLGGLLSLQVGSSASPVSGTVFMALLMLSLTALGIGLRGTAGVEFLVPLVVAACVAICAANDSSQDYRTVQLNGFRVADSFVGHLVGLLGGAIVVPLTLGLVDRVYGLGSGALALPQAGFFATVLKSLFLDEEIPWAPVGVGAGLGALAVAMDVAGRRRGMILSSLAFAVGIYLNVATGIGILLGALARFAATRKLSASTHEGVLSAAGLITGYACAELVLGILILLGVVAPVVQRTNALLPGWVGVLGLVALLALLARNFAVRGAGRAPER